MGRAEAVGGPAEEVEEGRDAGFEERKETEDEVERMETLATLTQVPQEAGA